MKNMKKLLPLALALVIVSVLAIAIPAFAATTSLSAAPGKYTTSIKYVAGSSVSASARMATTGSNNVVTVELHAWDTDEVDPDQPTSGGRWMLRRSVTLTNSTAKTLSYTFNSKETQYRFRIKAPASNLTTQQVSITH